MQNTQRLAKLMNEQEATLFYQAYGALLHREETVFEHGIGCEAGAVFDLASVSKLVTGTMVFMLAGQGKIDLDAPLTTYFAGEEPGPMTKVRFAVITPAQLLAHHAGIPPWYPFYTSGTGFWPTLERLMQHPPEIGAVYSDIGFMLLGLLVQKASGQSLAKNLEKLNGELGTNFMYNPRDAQACIPTEHGNRVEMEMCAQRGLTFAGWRPTTAAIQGAVNDGNAYYFWQGAAGHAGVFGAARDLLELARLYLREGEAKGKQLIPAALVQRSFVPWQGDRGLMWDLSATFPHGAGHTGFTGTALWVCPQQNSAMVLLASRLALPGPPNLQAWRQECFTAAYQACR